MLWSPFVWSFLPAVTPLLFPSISTFAEYYVVFEFCADYPNVWNQIKADRGEMEHGDKDIEQLQKETAKKANDAARVK